MPILPDLSYARTRSEYVPKNVEYIDQIGANLEKDYTANQTKTNLLLEQINNLKVRNPNTPILESAVNKAKTGIQALADKGDYENADLEITRLASELNNDPLLKGALQDYNQYQEHQKQLAELKDVNADRVQLAGEYSNATNNKMIEYDPTTGYKNMYKGYIPVKTPDFEKIVGDFTAKIKSSKSPIAIGQDAKGNPIYMGKANNGYYIVGDREGIDEGEALQIISSHVASNPQMQGYIKENLMFDKYKRKYNPVTGQFDSFSVEDLGDPSEMYNKLRAEGYNPDEFMTPENIERLYDATFLEKNLMDISKPYAQAASFTDTKFDYKADTEWLNKQKSQLALNNALAKMKAEEAKEKRIIDYKYKKDEELEQRKNPILTNPVETEAVNLEIAEKNLEKINSDLALLTAKKEAATKGGTAADGSPITFSPEENAKLISLQNDQRLLTFEKNSYLQHAVDVPVGKEIARKEYDRYVKYTKNPEGITYEEFENKLRNDDIPKPKQTYTSRMSGVSGVVSSYVDDPQDINSYLKNAKTNLGKDKTVQVEANKALSLEANSYFTADDGSNAAWSCGRIRIDLTVLPVLASCITIWYITSSSVTPFCALLNGRIDTFTLRPLNLVSSPSLVNSLSIKSERSY